MTWDVVRGVSDAATASREFLFPVEAGRWLRLCLLSLFVTMGWIPFSLARLLPFPEVLSFDTSLLPTVFPDALLLALGGGIAVSVLALADPFARFVFLDALRYDRLHLTERVGERLGRAVRLLLFTLGAVALATAATWTTTLAVRSGWRTLTGGFGNIAGPADIAVTLVAGTVLGFVGVVFLGVLHAAATLVPPAMVSTGDGAIAAWERVWNAFAGRRGAYLSYLVVRLALTSIVALLCVLVGAILTSVLGLLAFVVLVAVFGSVAGATAVLGTWPLAVTAVLLIFGFVVLPVRGAALTLLLTYDIAVLGAVAPDLALPDADVGGSRTRDATVELSGETPIVEEPLTTATNSEPGTEAGDDGAEPAETGSFEFGVAETPAGAGSADDTDGAAGAEPP